MVRVGTARGSVGVGATGWARLWLHAAVATGLGGLYMAGSGLWFQALGRGLAAGGTAAYRVSEPEVHRAV